MNPILHVPRRRHQDRPPNGFGGWEFHGDHLLALPSARHRGRRQSVVRYRTDVRTKVERMKRRHGLRENR
jgi:hypothetical protein